MMLAFSDRISRARVLLERKGQIANDFLKADILSSWSRCIEHGLDPLREPEHVVIDKAELCSIREQNESLTRLASIEIRNLYSQISGSNFAIVFADGNGTILESIADDTFNTIADSKRIIPGSVWSETISGTNALGVVVKSQNLSTVHAGEHFFRFHGDLTCVAAPIFDPSGGLVGIIDASSDCHSRQYHTHALVKMSCLTIENGLYRSLLHEHIIIELHNRYEFLGTLQAGIIVVDEDGTLIAANRQAHYLLQGLPLHAGSQFKDIFQSSFSTFYSSQYQDSSCQLVDMQGSTFAVSICNPRKQLSPKILTQLNSHNSVFVSKELPPMVYKDHGLQAIVTRISKSVIHKVPIHIRGESGTGKEMLAQFAHTCSGRSGKFIAVNCAALPESLIESELFGYHGGAFTGANKSGATGLIKQADGGTLFLDEIGDMPLLLQATMLRFLDNWCIRAVGDSKEQKVDILLITATNRNLEEAVENKLFRADLLYRINTIDVHIPALRHRSDLPELAEAIINDFIDPFTLDYKAYNILKNHNWPGNIRELKNFLIRVNIELGNSVLPSASIHSILTNMLPSTDKLQTSRSLRDQELNIVIDTYERLNGNISAIARELGISRNSVYNKLKRVNIV